LLADCSKFVSAGFAIRVIVREVVIVRRFPKKITYTRILLFQ